MSPGVITFSITNITIIIFIITIIIIVMSWFIGCLALLGEEAYLCLTHYLDKGTAQCS